MRASCVGLCLWEGGGGEGGREGGREGGKEGGRRGEGGGKEEMVHANNSTHI